MFQPAQLIINVGHAQQLIDRDWDGNLISELEARQWLWKIENEIKFGDKVLGFQFIAEVPKLLAADAEIALKLVVSWCRQKFAPDFRNHQTWNFFDIRRVQIAAVPVDEAPRFNHIACDVELSESMVFAIDSTARDLSALKSRFELAKDALFKLATQASPVGIAYAIGEARAHFRTLESIVECSASFGYGPADVRSALRSYEEMARRKVESNHNYKVAQGTVRKVAYGVSFPTSWHKRPAMH